MDQIRSYILSLILTAVLCGLLPNLLREGGPKTLIKTVCGLVLTATVLSPLGEIRLELPQELPLFREEAALAAAGGEDLAHNALSEVIRAEAEAYILNKAARWEADIQVELELSREPPYAPVAARFSGEISDQGKKQLQELLVTEFAIPKEAQTWMP